MLAAQRQINDMLQLSPFEERNQMMQELQALREENQSLRAKVQDAKAKRMQEQVLPRPAQEKKYTYVPVGVHNFFVFYQDDDMIQDIDEMDQPLQDQAPSPLNDP